MSASPILTAIKIAPTPKTPIKKATPKTSSSNTKAPALKSTSAKTKNAGFINTPFRIRLTKSTKRTVPYLNYLRSTLTKQNDSRYYNTINGSRY